MSQQRKQGFNWENAPSIGAAFYLATTTIAVASRVNTTKTCKFVVCWQIVAAKFGQNWCRTYAMFSEYGHRSEMSGQHTGDCRYKGNSFGTALGKLLLSTIVQNMEWIKPVRDFPKPCFPNLSTSFRRLARL
jgi:hypothetical protein